MCSACMSIVLFFFMFLRRKSMVLVAFSPTLNVCAVGREDVVYLVRPGDSCVLDGVKSSDVVFQKFNTGKNSVPAGVLSKLCSPVSTKTKVRNVVWSKCSSLIAVVFQSTLDLTCALSVVDLSKGTKVVQSFAASTFPSSVLPVLSIECIGGVAWGPSSIYPPETKIKVRDFSDLISTFRTQTMRSIGSDLESACSLRSPSVTPLFVADVTGSIVLRLEGGILISQHVSMASPRSGSILLSSLFCGVDGCVVVETKCTQVGRRWLTTIPEVHSTKMSQHFGSALYFALHSIRTLRHILESWAVESRKLCDELRLTSPSCLVGEPLMVCRSTLSLFLDCIFGTAGIDTVDHVVDYFGLPQTKSQEDPRERGDRVFQEEVDTYLKFKQLFDFCSATNQKAIDADVVVRCLEKLNDVFATSLLVVSNQVDSTLLASLRHLEGITSPLLPDVVEQVRFALRFCAEVKAAISEEHARLVLLARYALSMKSEICRTSNTSIALKGGVFPSEQADVVRVIEDVVSFLESPKQESVYWLRAIATLGDARNSLLLICQWRDFSGIDAHIHRVQDVLKNITNMCNSKESTELPLSAYQCCVLSEDVLSEDVLSENDEKALDDGCNDVDFVACLTDLPTMSPRHQHVHHVTFEQASSTFRIYNSSSRASGVYAVDIDLTNKEITHFEPTSCGNIMVAAASKFSTLSIWFFDMNSRELVEFANGPEIQVPLRSGCGEVGLAANLPMRMVVCAVGGQLTAIDLDAPNGETQSHNSEDNEP